MLERSFELARDLGYDTIVIFGHPGNYVSRGFKSCKKYNVCLSDHIFQFDMSGYEEFDKNFEQYMPEEKPCQEEFYILSHARIFE